MWRKRNSLTADLAVMTVTDYAENWLNIKVPQTVLNALAEGQEMKVYLPGKEDQAITGTIEDISSKAEFATSQSPTMTGGRKIFITYNVKIRLDAPDVRPGMNAYVRFE
jgi:HlyD family secretion protein